MLTLRCGPLSQALAALISACQRAPLHSLYQRGVAWQRCGSPRTEHERRPALPKRPHPPGWNTRASLHFVSGFFCEAHSVSPSRLGRIGTIAMAVGRVTDAMCQDRLRGTVARGRITHRQLRWQIILGVAHRRVSSSFSTRRSPLSARRSPSFPSPMVKNEAALHKLRAAPIRIVQHTTLTLRLVSLASREAVVYTALDAS